MTEGVRRLVQLLALLLLVASLSPLAGAATRPYQGNGNCLSCHGRDLPTLPPGSCLSCHSGSMDFLAAGHQAGPDGDAALSLLGATVAGTTGLLLLFLVPAVRRLLVFVAAVAVATLVQAVDVGELPVSPLPGAFRAADGFACDLAPTLAPTADALVFAARGPDTNGDGRIDLRDDLALYLLPRDATRAVALTPHVLDFSAAMAAWSADGKRLVVPQPFTDTDGDGRLTHADRLGLAVYDASGRRLATLASGTADSVQPLFAPDGQRVAFVQGTRAALWDLASGTTRTLADLGPDQFPRLFAWPEAREHPLFTRGYAYARLPRDASHDYAPPPEVAIESAAPGGLLLTAPAGEPRRRARPQAASGAIFYLVDDVQGGRGLFRVDANAETRWTPVGLWVYDFVPTKAGGCWALVAEHRGGAARLTHLRSAGQLQSSPAAWEPRLLTLALTADDRALVAGAPRGLAQRALFATSFGSTPYRLSDGAWFTLTTAGSALAGVRVTNDSDGDGLLTPLDQGELWIGWEAL
jgi:hypothetical protein